MHESSKSVILKQNSRLDATDRQDIISRNPQGVATSDGRRNPLAQAPTDLFQGFHLTLHAGRQRR
jgi:hypothetical protein